MSDDLSSVFGEEFAEKYEKERNRRRQERQQVNEETLAAIASQVINDDKFDAENPVTDYTSDANITHDVVLMKLPSPDNKSIWSYKKDLDSGAITVPLEYMGEWTSCLFNNPDMAKEMEEGQYYVVVGNMDTWTDDEGKDHDQMSPVRGIIPLDKLQSYADQELEEQGFTDETDDDEDTTEEESSESEDSSGGMFGGDDDEEEETDVDIDAEVADTISAVAEGEDDFWGQVEDMEMGDGKHQKLTKVVINQTDGLTEDNLDEVGESAYEYIQEQLSDEEEDDEDDEEESLFG